MDATMCFVIRLYAVWNVLYNLQPVQVLIQAHEYKQRLPATNAV